MITEAILNLFFDFAEFLIGFIPIAGDMPSWADNMINVISYGLVLFPPDVLIVVIGNVTAWMGVHMLWIIIEWVYKKVPGVD